MGQDNRPIMKQIDFKNDLKLVDQKEALYFNICSRKYYTKTDLFLKDIADLEHELEVFNFRRINENLVVTADYCTNTFEKEMCTSFTNFSFFIQKVEYTLFEKMMIKVEEGIKMIMQVLRGFTVLYGQFGYFTPSSKMICFNETDQVKVWMNQDFRITKNSQYPHCPKSMVLQNNLIRQITRLFDYLRDPSQPLFRFSQNLPNNLFTFQEALNIFTKKLQETQRKSQCRPKVYKQVIKQPIIKIVSQRTSPVFSPCKIVPKIIFQTKPAERQQLIKYLSPRANCQPNLQQFKEAVSTSLQNSANKDNFLLKVTVPLSKVASSAVPVSLRNSRIRVKDSSQQLNSHSGFKKSQTKLEKISPTALKKQQTPRYSEAEPTSFARDLSPQTIVFQQKSLIRIEKIQKQSFEQSSKKKKIVFESILDPIPCKSQYQTHKRYRTDFFENTSNLNQKRTVEGSLIKNLNINTIKSIHLLEQDRYLDTDITVDLKKLINKYRQRS